MQVLENKNEMVEDAASDKNLSELLKQETSTTHESLDQRIMRAEPFATDDSYRQFLRMQQRFHAVSAGLFVDEELNELLPGLSQRCRLQQVLSDSNDLNMCAEEIEKEIEKVALTQRLPAMQALGWLYTIEGSNIGAAFLYKFAKKLEFDETFGAAHLAGHSEGRGKHWRDFKAAIDFLMLSEEERKEACIGARDAFSFVRKQVEEIFPVAY